MLEMRLRKSNQLIAPYGNAEISAVVVLRLPNETFPCRSRNGTNSGIGRGGAIIQSYDCLSIVPGQRSDGKG